MRGKKTEMINLRLTKTQRRTLKRQAKRADMAVSEYVRSCLWEFGEVK